LNLSASAVDKLRSDIKEAIELSVVAWSRVDTPDRNSAKATVNKLTLVVASSKSFCAFSISS